MSDSMTRRRAVLVIAGGVALVSCQDKGDSADDSGPGRDDSNPGTDDSGEALDICAVPPTPSAGWSALSSSDTDALATVGAWVYADFGSKRLVIAHAEEGCYVAVNRICTHEGCEIEYQNKYRRFKCPCHGAVYAEDGSKITGPQPYPVASFPCGIGSDGLVYVQV